MKCPYEHTLLVKHGTQGRILFVSLYMDDLIYTGNDLKMVNEFKQSMKGEVAMTNLGRMRYLLGIEVKQGSDEVFIYKQKYATEVLNKFGMEECNKVCSPIVQGCNLVKDE